MRKLFVSLALALFAFTLVGQETPPAPQLFYVHEEVAKPSMVAEYEKVGKEFISTLRNANLNFHYEAIAGDDFHYYFVIPLKNMADIDKLMMMFMAEMPQKVGAEKVADLMRRSGATMEHTNEWVVLRRDDISYVPAKPRLKMEESPWGRYDYYYLQPGTEMMVDSIANDWKSALAAANVPDGFTLYQVVIGNELPLVIVETRGKDPADIAAHEAKNMAALGSKGQALQAKTMTNVRRFERKYGVVRPDLSNPAPRQATKQ